MRQATMKAAGLLYVLSAPSGAGKTSISRELLARRPQLRESISYTTRARRDGEQDGIDYHFVSREEFERMVAADAFVEWARVHGNCYGTARATITEALKQGHDLLLDIDVQGAAQLRASGLDGVFIFILPPDMAELRKRLHFRNTDADEVIDRRLANAAGEIAGAVDFDYLVVNDDLAQAVQTVEAIMGAEQARTRRVLPQLPAEFGLK
ncbi:MAG: guanylate kinase [Desulfuromonadales bacterium]|nr:guanylate kinase [Desulfuromonadales bacterium]